MRSPNDTGLDAQGLGSSASLTRARHRAGAAAPRPPATLHEPGLAGPRDVQSRFWVMSVASVSRAALGPMSLSLGTQISAGQGAASTEITDSFKKEQTLHGLKGGRLKARLGTLWGAPQQWVPLVERVPANLRGSVDTGKFPAPGRPGLPQPTAVLPRGLTMNIVTGGEPKVSRMPVPVQHLLTEISNPLIKLPPAVRSPLGFSCLINLAQR